MSKGGGTQTSTTVQQIDPEIKAKVFGSVDRATGIANSPFQAFNGNPYAGVAPTGGTPGYWSGGTNNIIGFDDQGNPQYDSGPAVWNPGTPGTTPTFDVNNFVAPLSANENMASDAARNLYGVGSGALGSAINTAGDLSGFQPGTINPATAGTAYAGAAAYDPTTLGSAPSMNGATAGYGSYNPSLLGNAPQASATNASAAAWNPTMLGAAPQASTSNASYSPVTASTANAAQINRGDISNLSGGDLLAGISKYQNPYTSDVVNAALGDIETQRQRALGNNTDSFISSGAFGDASRRGVADSLTNEFYGKQAAQTAAQLRAAGFDTAAGLAQSDAARSLQAQGANQAVDQSVAANNANFRQGTNLANMDALNNIGLNNAQGLFGASAFNAGAANDTGKFNTANIADFLKSNAATGNAAGQFNASNQTSNNQFNANNANNFAQYNNNNVIDFMGRNNDALNAAGIFGANAGNVASLANAGYAQDAAKTNLGLNADFQTRNADALNQARQFNATNQQGVNLANMAAANANNQFNVGQINNAQGQNIANQLAGAGVQQNAAGLLGNLSNQQQTNAQNYIQGLLATGGLSRGLQQQGLDAAISEFMRQQNYPYQGQNLINASLGLLPNSGTTTSTGPGQDTTGQTIGALGSLAGGVGMIMF